MEEIPVPTDPVVPIPAKVTDDVEKGVDTGHGVPPLMRREDPLGVDVPTMNQTLPDQRM